MSRKDRLLGMRIFILIIASAIPSGIIGGVVGLILYPIIGLWEFIPTILVGVWVGFVTGSIFSNYA